MTAYRQSAPSCPTCHEPLETHSIAEPATAVDLCARCGGVWIDWEDGDFIEIAREVPAARVREMPRSGPGSCPRCNRPLAAELFLDTAEVLRCAECLGAFLPYASIGKIAAGTPAEARAGQREPREQATPHDPGPMEQAVSTLRGWMRRSVAALFPSRKE